MRWRKGGYRSIGVLGHRRAGEVKHLGEYPGVSDFGMEWGYKRRSQSMKRLSANHGMFGEEKVQRKRN